MEKFFKIKESGSTVKTEIMAGITTFMAMAYILMVNANMFTEISVSYGAVYIATALSAVIGTLCMGLIAKLPLALASGMGINAFFVYTVCIGSGLTYANALVLIFFEGILFILLTVTGLRKMLFDAIPDAVKKAIPAGIGLFIAFLGLQNAGIVVNSDATLVNLVSFNVLNGVTWAQIMPIIVTIFGVIAIAVLSKRNVKGAVFWGIIGSAIVYYLLGFTINGFYNGFVDSLTMNPFDAFKAFGTESVGKVFTEGFDFSAFLAVEGHDKVSLILVIITSGLAFCMVDMFDTMGTLYGACARGDMLDKDGNQVSFGAKGLKDIETITEDHVIPELKECSFRVACDVTNTLCGEFGCSAVFGPQKGADKAMIFQMDEWLAYYAKLTSEKYANADAKYPGTGAAGGMGFAFLAYTNAVLESGIKIILEETNLESYVKDADVVVTGEGRLDGQTVFGKAPIGVAKIAKKYDKTVLAFAGAVMEDAVACNEHGMDAFFPILRRIQTLQEAMEPSMAKENMIAAAEQVFRLIKVRKN